MIWVTSSIAVAPWPALTTVFSVFGDMQDNSRVAMYFGCCGSGTRSLMVYSSINIFSHTSNESFLSSVSKRSGQSVWFYRFYH